MHRERLTNLDYTIVALKSQPSTGMTFRKNFSTAEWLAIGLVAFAFTTIITIFLIIYTR
ncbi:unnamed protein product [Caenorhabditis brenneri]